MFILVAVLAYTNYLTSMKLEQAATLLDKLTEAKLDKFSAKLNTFRATVVKTLGTGGSKEVDNSLAGIVADIVKDVAKDMVKNNPRVQKIIGQRLDQAEDEQPPTTE